MKNIITRKIKASKSKFNSKQSYSGFWMNDSNYYNNVNRFAGLGETTKSNDMVKVIKLASYRKAVANFVKIVTKKDIPVIFKGTESYTDFDKIVLTTDIKDDNFDVTVGLALHEGSHILYTDRKYLEGVYEHIGDTGLFPTSISVMIGGSSIWTNRWKGLTNWIEDRRIDSLVFKSSPGYKAYYHKMYDYYWNDASIDKALKAPNAFVNPTVYESYEFRIINCLNPNSKKDALPGLRDILNTININTISRLKSVEDSGKLAGEVIDKIFTLMQEAEDKKQQQSQDQPQEQGQMPGNGQGEGGEENTPTDDTNTADVPDGEGISSQDILKAFQKMEAQKKFTNGEVKKQESTKAMSTRLEALKRVDVEVQQVGGTGGVSTFNALIYNLTTNNLVSDLASIVKDKHSRLGNMSHQDLYELNKRIDALRAALPESVIGSSLESEKIYTNDGDKDGRDAIELGLELGALLGRKLSTRNEVRELVYNRTRTGSIDKKRLAEAGYGVESVFKQIHVDKYKKGLLHISLDASGSMHGVKWANTLLMTVAICKAVSYVQNLDVTVDLRCTERGGRTESPVCVWLYDSRINKLNHLTAALSLAQCCSMTPEGLCTEALIKRGYYKKSDATLDTFYLNICDGQPGGISGYDGGTNAQDHTRRQVNILRNELNMQTLGYFVSSRTSNGKIQEAATIDEAYSIDSAFGCFCNMYGARHSKYAPASDMFAIAKHMNNLFMSNGCMA